MLPPLQHLLRRHNKARHGEAPHDLEYDHGAHLAR